MPLTIELPRLKSSYLSRNESSSESSPPPRSQTVRGPSRVKFDLSDNCTLLRNISVNNTNVFKTEDSSPSTTSENSSDKSILTCALTEYLDHEIDEDCDKNKQIRRDVSVSSRKVLNMLTGRHQSFNIPMSDGNSNSNTLFSLDKIAQSSNINESGKSKNLETRIQFNQNEILQQFQAISRQRSTYRNTVATTTTTTADNDDMLIKSISTAGGELHLLLNEEGDPQKSKNVLKRQKTSKFLSGVVGDLNESTRSSRWKIARGYLADFLGNRSVEEGRKLVLELLVVGANRAYGLWKENIDPSDFDDLINSLVPEKWQISTNNEDIESHADPEIPETEKSSKMQKFKPTKSTREIEKRYKILLTLFSVTSGLIYGLCIFFFQVNDTARRIVGPGLIVARASALGSVFWSAILFQTMSKHLNTWLFRITHWRYFLIGHTMHLFAAGHLIIDVFVHVFFHLCTTVPTVAGAANLEELNEIVQCETHWPRWILWPMCDPVSQNYNAWQVLFVSVVGLTGVVLIFLLYAMWWTSQPKFRKKHYNIFSKVHVICLLLYVFLLIVHGSNNWVGLGWPIAYLLLPITAYYLYTRFIRREWGSYCSAKIIRFEPLSVSLMEIDVELKSSSFFKRVFPGQFLLMNLPILSKFEYHPFSVCFINKERPSLYDSAVKGKMDDDDDIISIPDEDEDDKIVSRKPSVFHRPRGNHKLIEMISKRFKCMSSHKSSLPSTFEGVQGSPQSTQIDEGEKQFVGQDGKIKDLRQVVTFIVTIAGDWTKQAYSKLADIDSEIVQLADSASSVAEGSKLLYADGSAILNIPCRVDGPFSAPAQGMFKELNSHRSVVICIGAGVGITPFLSVLEAIERQEGNSEVSSEFHLFWMTRKLSDFMTAGRLIDTRKLQGSKMSTKVYPHLFVTGGDDMTDEDTSAFLFRSAISNICRERGLDDHISLHDPSGHLLSNIRFGRPEFTREFITILDDCSRCGDYTDFVNVSVYVCGGVSVQNSVRAACDAGVAYKQVNSSFTILLCMVRGLQTKKRNKQRLILDRYILYENHLLGSGSFAYVYSGYDTVDKCPVAIKVYNYFDEQSFKNEITRLSYIHDSDTGKDIRCGQQSASFSVKEFSPESASDWSIPVSARPFVVSINDYSRRPTGTPTEIDGRYYIILELGQNTLETEIKRRRRENAPFDIATIQRIVRSMLDMLFCLHSVGLVHLDFKPDNIIMFENGSCKLIDLDGTCEAGMDVEIETSAIAFTPLYVAPEFARQISGDSMYLRVSRKMDIWSMGMSILCMISNDHPIEEVFNCFEDAMSFYNWLGELRMLRIPQKIKKIDKDLFDFLVSTVNPNTDNRLDIVQLRNHKFVQKNIRVPFTFTRPLTSLSTGFGSNIFVNASSATIFPDDHNDKTRPYSSWEKFRSWFCILNRI